MFHKLWYIETQLYATILTTTTAMAATILILPKPCLSPVEKVY